jgi:signal transduction histidine kinase
MTKVSAKSTEWQDSFYGSKIPRTALCLPISAQGRPAGVSATCRLLCLIAYVQVILLSSMIIDNPRARSAAAREVISCLATFATLVALNQNFTRRLKHEVDERTKQLRDALAAKTQFLSQCSHELRSPLSAVLVRRTGFVFNTR